MPLIPKRLSVAILAALTNTALANEQIQHFDLPAQPLTSSLQALANQTGEPMLYAEQTIAGKRSPRVSGDYTPRQAAALLLADSGLDYKVAADGTLTVKPGDKPLETSTEQVTTLKELTVKAYRYLPQEKETTGITNLPLSIDKVPQSISVATYDFIKAADLKTLGEVAQYTPGALWASYSPSYGNQIWLRGFAANFAFDGVTVGDQVTEPDMAMLERMEIVKGPASVVYGPQSPGGIVNLVSKRANPDTPSFVSMQGGSFDRYRIDAQVSNALNDSGSIRGIGVVAYQNGGSFIDYVKQDKAVAYGGLDFDLAKGMSAYVNGSWQRTSATPFNGIPTYANGQTLSVPDSTFLGSSNLMTTENAFRGNAGWSWDVNKLWNVGVKMLGQETIHQGGNAYNYGNANPNGTFYAGGEAFNSWNSMDYSVVGSASRKLDDFGLTDSSISASLRYQHYRYTINENTGGIGNAPSIFNDTAVSNYINSIGTAGPGTSIYQQDQIMDYITGSTQAVIKLAKPLTAIGGISVSDPMISVQTYGGSFVNYSPGAQAQYRGSLVYEPIERLNLYGSYSQSYQPNLRVDSNLQVIKPLSGEQFEVGAKYNINKKLLLSTALFQINENNVAVQTGSINGEAIYSGSSVRHRGGEIEATGFITDRWQIKAGGALLDPITTGNPSTATTAQQSIGQTRAWLPTSSANLFSNYNFDNGFSIGGGTRFNGSVKTSYNGEVLPIPSYLLFDAMATYTFGKWRAQFNLKNILDDHYNVASPIFGSTTLYPGEPRTFALSLRRDF